MACAQVMNDNDLARFRTKLCQRYLTGICEFDGRCQYSHKQKQHQRRCPFLLLNKEPLAVLRYIPVLCEYSESECYRGMGCPFAHSQEEILYHPLIYKQKLCSTYHQHIHEAFTFSTSPSFLECQNKMCDAYYCPFVHDLKEKRIISNFSYFLAPSFSNKLSSSVPEPLTRIPVSKINTSRLSGVNLKDSPWLKSLIMLNSSSEAGVSHVSSLSLINNSLESRLLTTQSDLIPEHPVINSSHLLEISSESVKLGCLYLAAGFLTQRDLVLSQDAEEDKPVVDYEQYTTWSPHGAKFKSLDASECPTLLNKVFLNNSCFSKTAETKQLPILWLSPGDVVQVLFIKTPTQNAVEGNTRGQGATASFQSCYDGTQSNHSSIQALQSDRLEWVYGRCVLGSNKGEKGWFPLSLCFGFHQEETSCYIQLPRALLYEEMDPSKTDYQDETLIKGFRTETNALCKQYIESVSGTVDTTPEVEEEWSSSTSFTTPNDTATPLLIGSYDEETKWLKDMTCLGSTTLGDDKKEYLLQPWENSLESNSKRMPCLTHLKTELLNLYKLLEEHWASTLSSHETTSNESHRQAFHGDTLSNVLNWKEAMRMLCLCELSKPVVVNMLNLLNEVNSSLSVQTFESYEGKYLADVAKKFMSENGKNKNALDDITLENYMTRKMTLDIHGHAPKNSEPFHNDCFSFLSSFKFQQHELSNEANSSTGVKNERDPQHIFSMKEKECYLPQLQSFNQCYTPNPSAGNVKGLDKHPADLLELNRYMNDSMKNTSFGATKNYTLLPHKSSPSKVFNPTVTPPHKSISTYEADKLLNFWEPSRVSSIFYSADSSSTADYTDSSQKRFNEPFSEIPHPSKMSFSDHTAFSIDLSSYFH